MSPEDAIAENITLRGLLARIHDAFCAPGDELDPGIWEKLLADYGPGADNPAGPLRVGEVKTDALHAARSFLSRP